MKKRAILKKEQIVNLTPYGDPFLFLDTATLHGKKNITAKKKITGKEWFFKGHFVGYPLMPGSLTLEAIGQAATLIIRKNIKKHESKDVLLCQITNATFRRPIFPGDTICLKVDIDHRKGNLFYCTGTAFKDKKVACEAAVTLIVIDKKKFRKK